MVRTPTCILEVSTLPKIEIEKLYSNGKHLATVELEKTDFDEKKAVILADPDKTGYDKAFLDKLHSEGWITTAEKDAAKLKATK